VAKELERRELEAQMKADAAAREAGFAEFQKALEEHNRIRAEQQQPGSSSSSSSDSSSSSKSSGPSLLTKGAGTADLLALEKAAKKKVEEEAAKMKPVFLTKEERKKLREEEALKRLHEQRAREAEGRAAMFAAVMESARERRERERRERERQREEEEKKREERERTKEDKDYERYKQQIRESYLGRKQEKKKVVPPSQKFKFAFDWEPEEDTTRDANPLLAKNRVQVNLLFGRGFIAGVDRREQIKQAKFYHDLVEARKNGQDIFAGIRDEAKAAERKSRELRKYEEVMMANRHWSEKKLEEMTERDWRIFKEDFSITTRGARVPNPMRYWHEAGLPPALLEAIERAGYKEPTPIQRAAIPVGLKNMDLVGIAETGSGKTCAFVIPMLVYISKQPKLEGELIQNGPYAVVMAPTRELAQQISGEIDKLGRGMGIRNVAITGGASLEEQGFAMRDGVEVVVATPGRLFDAIQRRYIALNQCNYIVLDEADRMLDMGFEPQIQQILDTLPSSNMRPDNPDEMDEKKVYRQTTMFSATMPLKVELLARKYLRHPVFVAIGDRSGRVNTNVTQVVEMISEGKKKQRLIELLGTMEPPIIVFTNTKKNADALARHIEIAGFSVTVLHGGKIQDQRESALDAFKQGAYDILVATDVVGRGIDIPDVQNVINYDMPSDIEKYQHRIGRTGRAGKKGTATSFVTDQDTHIYFDLVQKLKEANQYIPPELERHEASKVKPGTIVDKPKKKEVVFAA